MRLTSCRKLGVLFVTEELISLTKVLQCFPHAFQADEERVA
jgi:hypothetical protein